MITNWPYPGSSTVVCSMGEHERCQGSNCSCDCHLQSRALHVMHRLTVAQERRLKLFIERVLGVKSI
jgi:hypothetical protein